MNDYRYKKCCKNNNCNMNMDCDDKMDEIIEHSEECSHICTMPKNDCECGFDMNTHSVFPENPMYAQSYVPVQKMKKVFTPEVGLKMGTIFPELVSPYEPCQSIREIEYIRNTNKIGEGCNR